MTKFILKFGLFSGIFLVALAFVFASSFAFAGGGPNQDPNIEIVGGQNADIKDYPWQIAIFGIDESGNITEQMCGGSIIDPYWILTAAHCVMPKSHKTQKIVAQITKLSNASSGQIIEISDFIIHPQYDEEALANDIALLRLATPIDTSVAGTSVVRIITPDEYDLIAPGIMGTITGWGTTEYMGNQPDNLKVGVLPIISIETANQWFAEMSEGIAEVLESMLPLGFEQGGVSACHGDSGGPLVVRDDNGNWVLAGITSWGDVCGGEKQPAVYTRVPFFYNWILDHSGIGSGIVPVSDNYIKLVKIDVPQQAMICDESSDFGDILIHNFATNNLTSFDLTVKIGNSPSDILATETKTITLDQPIPPNGSKRIELPASLIPDNYVVYFLQVEVSNPNGANIQLSENVVETYFERVEPNPLTVKFELGDIQWGQWVIVAADSFSPIASGQFSQSDAGDTLQEQICLPAGEYMYYFMASEESQSEINISYKGKDYLIFRSNTSNSPGFFNFSIPFVPVYDVEVLTDLTMVNDSLYFCELNNFAFEPSFDLFNAGSLPIENISYKIILNENNYEGNLMEVLYPGNSTRVFLDTDHILPGKNDLSVEILSHDNIDDEEIYDNNSLNLTKHLFVVDKFGTLELRSDENYWDYSWTIYDNNDNILISNQFETSETHFADICLPEGCFFFSPENWNDEGIDQDTAVIFRKVNGDILFVIKGEDFLADKTVQFCNTVSSVNDNSNLFVKTLKLFPNPASNAVFMSIHSENPTNAKVEVIDLIGNKHLSLSRELGAGDNQLSLDVSSLANGVYIVRIVSGTQVISKKITIKR